MRSHFFPNCYRIGWWLLYVIIFGETHPFALVGAEWVFCCPYLEVASAKNTLKLHVQSLLQILLQGQTKTPYYHPLSFQMERRDNHPPSQYAVDFILSNDCKDIM